MSHIYKKKDIWYISFYKDGKQYKKSLKTKSKTTAGNAQKMIDYEITAGKFDLNKYFPKNIIKLKDFSDIEVEYKLTNKSSGTARIDRRAFDSLLEFCGDIPLTHINFNLMEDYKKYVLNSKGLTVTTVNMYIRHLKSAFTYAVKSNFLNEHPIKEVKEINIEKNIHKFLKPEQALQLLDYVKNRSVYIYILIALQTGARNYEVNTLKWEKIDFENNLLILKGKGSKERVVPMPARLKEELLARSKERKDDDDGYVVPGSRTNSQTSRNFKKYARQIGLGEFHFHDLRHTYASWLAQENVNTQVIQEILGHVHIGTTTGYTHIKPETKKIASSVLDKVFDPKEKS